MVSSRLSIGGRSLWAAVASAVLMVGLLVGLSERPAEAVVTAIKGEACAYSVNVGLFGGPQTLNGCNEGTNPDNTGPARAPAGGTNLNPSDISYSPHVKITGSGSMSASDAVGAKAQYGPAVIHGGMWPCEDPGTDPDGDGTSGNCPATTPGSGPHAAATSGSVAGGTVTASADINLYASPPTVPCYPGWGPVCVNRGGFGPYPVQGESLHTECSASEGSITGSTTFVGASVATSTDGDGNPIDFTVVDDNPAPNTTISGVISNVGDVFTVVLNEQIVNADGSLTVNAVHMYLYGPVAVGEVIRGQVTCGVTPSPLTPDDEIDPTCGIPVPIREAPVGEEGAGPPLVPRQELAGMFDAGGIQSVTNIQVFNGTHQVGNDPNSAFDYLKFTPGQKSPLALKAFQTQAQHDAGLPLAWSWDITDVAGNTVHCRGVNDLVATDDTFGGPLGLPVTVVAPGVLANDVDADGNTLTAGSASDPANGSVTLNSDGSFTYTRDAGFIGTDSFTYVMSDGAGGTQTATVNVEVTGPTTLSVRDISLPEGNSGTTPFTFTVTRTGNVDGPTTVSYKATGGTANAEDYTSVPTATPITFAAGETAKQVTINVNGDTVPEKEEKFTFSLSGQPKGTVLGDASATALIRNDDGASFLSVRSLNVVEGNSGTTPANFVVTRSGNTASTTTVTAQTKGGSAVPGTDYTGVTPTVLTFTPGQTSKTVTATVNGDTTPEANDSINLVLSGASVGAVLADPSGTAYIDDDDGTTAAPSGSFLEINNIIMNEGNGGSNTATFTVTRYGDTSAVSTVNYKTGGGTATAPEDFTAVTGLPLTFGIGESTKTFDIVLTGGTVPEKDESLTVALFGPSKGTLLGDASASVTLLNDDLASYVGVGNIQVSEGNSGSSVVNVPITRYGNTTSAATVKAKAGGGNASAGSDYTTFSEVVVSFAAGQDTVLVPVTIHGDTGVELSETFNVSLYAPGLGVTMADASGTVTIVNDDA